MIVRINQLDASRAEADSGWPAGGPTGPLRGAPTSLAFGAKVFELLILDQDEQGRPLSETFRRAQLRQMLPQAIAALREPGEEVVLRLDGALADGELFAAFRWLTDSDGRGRFAFSAAHKRDPGPQEVHGSVRVHPSPRLLASICGDMALGLERSVRLRAVCVPEDAVNGALDPPTPEDPRWDAVLSKAGFVLGSTRGLRSLQITTVRFDAATVKSRVMRRLMSAAAGPAPQPG
jgi:hypothetical protein